MQKILVESNSVSAQVHRQEVVARRVVGLLHEAQAAGQRLQQSITMKEERIGRLLLADELLRQDHSCMRAELGRSERHRVAGVEEINRLETTLLEQLRKKVDNNERLRCLLSETMARKDSLVVENGRIHSGLWLYQRATAALAVLFVGALATIAFI
jgi:hypothetical protein